MSTCDRCWYEQVSRVTKGWELNQNPSVKILSINLHVVYTETWEGCPILISFENVKLGIALGMSTKTWCTNRMSRFQECKNAAQLSCLIIPVFIVPLHHLGTVFHTWSVFRFTPHRDECKDRQRQADRGSSVYVVYGGTGREENIRVCRRMGYASNQLQIKRIQVQ